MNTTAHPMGFIGLGEMVSGMAACLVEANYPLSAWTRGPGTAEKFGKSGIQFLPSISELCARNRVIALNVIQTSDVEDLLFRQGGIADHAQTGTVVIDFSTIDSRAAQQFAKRLQAQKIDFMDCPVSGGSHGARAGTLSAACSGCSAGCPVSTESLNSLCSSTQSLRRSLQKRRSGSATAAYAAPARLPCKGRLS